ASSGSPGCGHDLKGRQNTGNEPIGVAHEEREPASGSNRDILPKAGFRAAAEGRRDSRMVGQNKSGAIRLY
ncbi:MAG TPA: hypothetical protein VKE92_04340, partial [Anaerolineales bacterium]|nr:hypothetical protein [Anaerolineales bacterium]